MTKREKMQSLDNKGFFEKIIEIAKLPKKELINWENYFNTDESEPYPWVPESDEVEKSLSAPERIVDRCENKKTDGKEKNETKRSKSQRKGKVKKSKKNFSPTPLDKCKKESGLIVRKRRNELKIKTTEFADEVGISKSAIGNFETGTSNLSDENLTNIAEILGIDAKYLIALANEEYEIEKEYGKQPKQEKETELSSMIKRAMKYRKLTPENCCTQLRVSPETVKRWMKGETIPSPEQENDVVRVFGFDMHEYQQARRKVEYSTYCERKEVVMDESTFRKMIIDERLRSGKSRETVDEELTLDYQTTKRIEKGLSPITQSLVSKYAQYFGITVDRVVNTVA